MSDPTSPSPNTDGAAHLRPNADAPLNGHRRSDSDGGLIRRSWVAMTDMLNPFSPAALASLPKDLSTRPRYTRADRIPEAEADDEGNMPAVRDYHAINSLPPRVRVPKKIATPIKVEAKVWFANERTWVSYLNIGVLIGTLALALFNASKDNVAKNFAYFYAAVSVGIITYGWIVYQQRISMIRRRDPGHFDQITGLAIVSALLFFAILANFVIRVQELRRREVPIPDPGDDHAP